MRKNQYEEALFRCEDDRFELDMAIECSQSAVRALTAVAEEISKLDAEGKERYRLDKDRVLSIHFRMVQKIYGAMPGTPDPVCPLLSAHLIRSVTRPPSLSLLHAAVAALSAILCRHRDSHYVFGHGICWKWLEKE